MENKTSTSLKDIVKRICENSLQTIKTICRRNQYYFDYIKLKFRALVFSDLSIYLMDSKYSFSEVYELFLEIYYEEYELKLLDSFCRE